MSEPDEDRADRLRAFATRVVDRVGGHPAVVRLTTVLDTFDRAGGGLAAGGLAYAALLALLPGLLFALTVFGLVVSSPAAQERILEMIAQALPPLEGVVRAAFAQVSAGAVPTSILAIAGLLWGSSRFYAAIDTAFSHIFRDSPRRNPVVQTVRGLLVTVVLVVLPIALIALGSILGWLVEHAPGVEGVQGLAAALVGAASPLGSLILFAGGTALTYRFVPAQHVPWRALTLPAILVGVVLAAFTQVFAFVAPRLVGAVAFYGAFVAVFALLAWLSIGFNLLLLGAAWTQVRGRTEPDAGR
jgi:membrane protein